MLSSSYVDSYMVSTRYYLLVNFFLNSCFLTHSTLKKYPIERLVLGANNIRGYPETVWKSDADGRLERFNLWTFQHGPTKWAKLNRDFFTLTLGSRQIPP